MNDTIVQVRVRGGDLTVGTWGSPSAERTLLLIHGVTASHLAWDTFAPIFAEAGFHVIAPDLRGRGRSALLPGPYGMAQHAQDMLDVLDELNIGRATVIGHSMGGFVAVSLADLAPERVEHLVLVDGGLPLSVPTGLSADEVIQLILGPTAERLSRTFTTVHEYLDFWKQHPGFKDHWELQYDDYFAYDLSGDEGALTPATAYEAAREDTVDLVQGTTVTDALTRAKKPILFVTCPRGLFDEAPGLYAPEHQAQILAEYPHVTHRELLEFNHYTVVMGKEGATRLAGLIDAELNLS